MKPIEEIEVGDRVLAYDEETRAQAYKEVVRLFRNETKEWYHVRVNGEEIVCTGGHPFYVASLQEFRPARELKVGTELLLSSGECATIEAVQVERLEDPGTTYNFEVADYHTYFVSECSVLVHNVCATTSDSSDDVLDWSRKRSDGMTTEEHVRLHEVSNNTRKYHIIKSGSGKTFREASKDYNVNMTKQQRTLHKKGSCPHSNGMYEFIPFDTLEEAEKFEQEHNVKFRRCGNCFRQGKK